MSFGNFTPVTFVNSSAPAINDTNLNAIETLLGYTDEELRRRKSTRLSEYIDYCQSRNSKSIEFFNANSSSWTAYGDGVVSDDTVNTTMNNGSVKVLEPNATSSWIGMYKTVPAIDLSYFQNGEDSASTSDLIMWLFYLSDNTKFNYLRLRLGSDQTNNYSITFTPSGFNNGWNATYTQKSNFTSNGTPPAWSNITYIGIFAQTTASATNEFLSFQLLYMYRQDPIYSGYFNPFQIYKGTVTGWENIFYIAYDSFGIFRDFGTKRTGIMRLDQTSHTGSEKSLGVFFDTLSFISKFEIYCKKDGEGPSISWWVDTSNYLEAYISSNTLYIYMYQAGVGTTLSKALDNNIELDERYLMYIEKNESLYRVIMHKEGEAPIILEATTTISPSSDGDIAIGHNGTTGLGLITDFVISRTQGDIILQEDTTPSFIWKKEDQTVNNSNILVDDDNLWAYLKGNRSYHVEAFISVSNTSSSTPNVKIAWNLTNCSYEYSRNHVGPATGSTNVSDSNVKISNSNISTAVAYGVVAGSDESFIKESFRIDSLEDGGKIQMQWAQDTSHASNTQILARSYLKITPMKLMR